MAVRTCEGETNGMIVKNGAIVTEEPATGPSVVRRRDRLTRIGSELRGAGWSEVSYAPESLCLTRVIGPHAHIPAVMGTSPRTPTHTASRAAWSGGHHAHTNGSAPAGPMIP